jgi:hypothetical protein
MDQLQCEHLARGRERDAHSVDGAYSIDNCCKSGTGGGVVLYLLPVIFVF